MKKYILIFGVASTVVAGVVIYNHLRKTKLEKKLVNISDAGYETAYDILYPLRPRKFRWRLQS
jgi:hypothetical protein